MFEGARILVTGGTGSMGKKLVRRLLSGERGVPEKIIILSRDEAKQHDMRLELMHLQSSTDEVIYNNFKRVLEFRIGDIRNYSDVLSAARDVDTIINAAAMKQVPTCEYFPYQAVMTNCLGAENIVRACTEPGINVKTVVGISTDKAALPVNVMGMTKAVQERIFISGNITAPETRFVCVRYGNVLASRGSVVPLFHKQIAENQPITITHADMTRFLISIDEAVDTVFSAIEHGKPGETFVPNAPAATIMNVAKALLGNRDLPIQIIGIRPGEKMHEIMVSNEECWRVRKCGNYYAIPPMLPELMLEHVHNENSPLTKEFSSRDNVVSFDETIALLKKHNLMVEDISQEERKEILR